MRMFSAVALCCSCFAGMVAGDDRGELFVMWASESSYGACRDRAAASGHLLAVLVSLPNDACAGCVQVRDRTLKPLVAQGVFVGCECVEVSADSALGRDVRRGSSVPCLVIYAPRADGHWRAFRFGPSQLLSRDPGIVSVISVARRVAVPLGGVEASAPGRSSGVEFRKELAD